MRLPTLPEVPPFAEAAGAPDFEANPGIYLRRRRRRGDHRLVAPEMRRTASAPDMKKRAAVGLLPLIALRRRHQQYIKSEQESGGSLVKNSGWKGRSSGD
jgi:hypothetical protein